MHFYLSRFSSRYRKLERWKELHVSACANICVCLSTHDTATYISLTRMLSLFILNLSAIVVAFSLVNTFPSQDQGHAMLYNSEWKNAEMRDIEHVCGRKIWMMLSNFRTMKRSNDVEMWLIYDFLLSYSNYQMYNSMN